MAGNADVQVGDMLTTSGVDGVYPPGLQVAKVAKVDRKIDSGFARIVAAAGGALRRRAPRAGARADRRCSCRRGRRRRRRESAAATQAAAPRKAAANDHAARATTSCCCRSTRCSSGSTLLVAFLLNIVPLGRVPAMPDFLALVLVFWNVHQPRRSASASPSSSAC